MLFIQDDNAHSQNRYVHLAEYTLTRNTLVLSTTTSGQLSSTPENDSSFTSWNTDGRCSTPAVHLPVKNSHVRRSRNHSSITPASGNGNDDINSALSKHLRLTGNSRLPTYSQNYETYTAHSYVIAKLIAVSLKTRQYLSKLLMTNSQ